jgi:hypothetical protein
MVAERGQDQADGITLRALNRQLAEHTIADEQRHRDIEARLRDDFDKRLRMVEAHAAFEEKMQTGRFNAPIQQLPPVTVNFDPTGGRSKRPSIPVIAKVLADPKAMTAIIGGLSLLGHVLLRLLMHH